MRPLKTTLREKNRYVYCISKNLNFKKDLHQKYKELYGKIHYSLAGIMILDYYEENEKIKCIVKVNRKYLKELVGCFLFLDARALIISGTLKSLRKKVKDLENNSIKT